jgi:hypothetical protein
LPAPGGHKVWGLPAYLIRSNVGVSRTHLAGLLFEDADDPLAALRWNLSELRRLLGNACLRGNTPELALEPATYIDIEVMTLATWVEALSVPGFDCELLEGMSFLASPSFECIWISTDADAAAEVLLISAYFERSGFRLPDRVASLIFRWVAPSPRQL